MKATKLLSSFLLLTTLMAGATFAQWQNRPIVTNAQISHGLKEALGQGVRSAVNRLGRDGGFLNNSRVRIPLPADLKRMESTLRFLGQGKRVDEFVVAMNNAAERAVPVATDIFVDSVMQMTFADAGQILFSGQEDAATQFFRRTSEERLRVIFRPIVEEFTNSVGVTQKYKSLAGSYGFIGRAFGQDMTDIDGYVTQKALDGLFLMIADEERRIRRDPIGRTTAILRTVFGAIR